MKRKAAFANELGSMMHKRRCGAFLRSLLHQCKGVEPAELLAAYTLGFLAHHVLDRNAHPFVFARQGSAKRDHQRLEVALDTLVAERMLRLDTRVTPVAPYLDCGPSLAPAVCAALTAAVKITYPQEWADRVYAELWNESYKDMIAAMRIFHDPYGVKRKLTGGAIEPFAPGRRDEAGDPANERKLQWSHPADQETTSRDSFWNIWEKSLEDGMRVLGSAAAWLRTAVSPANPESPGRRGEGIDDKEAEIQAAWDTFTQALGDLSYETGLTSEP